MYKINTWTCASVQWNPPPIPDTLGLESTVLIIEVSSFQGLEMWLIIVEYLVPVVCVHIKGKSPIQGAGLKAFHCIMLYSYMHMDTIIIQEVHIIKS